MAIVQGTCAPQFSKLRGLFQGFLDSGDELGASIAVNLNGEEVVDLYGGFADPERTKPWTADTIVNIYSSTKNAASLAVLKLIDEGIIASVDDPIVKYWPEFAEGGKERITIRDVLMHTAGLSGWDEPISYKDLCDFDKCCDLLAKQKPWWGRDHDKSNREAGYHSLTVGYLLGQLVRKATGGRKTLRSIVADDLAAGLQADFQVGCPSESNWDRVATLVPPPSLWTGTDGPPPPMPDSSSLFAKTFLNPNTLFPEFVHFSQRPDWRRAEIAAANGHANARGMVRLCTPISLGGAGVLKPETVGLIFSDEVKGTDVVIGRYIRRGVGFGLAGDGDEAAPLDKDSWVPAGSKIAFWPGYGGSIIVMDVGRKLTIGYCMNKMENDAYGNARFEVFIKAIYEALEDTNSSRGSNL